MQVANQNYLTHNICYEQKEGLATESLTSAMFSQI